MKYKTLFRLALKVIGVYMIATNLGGCIQYIQAFFNLLAHGGYPASPFGKIRDLNLLLMRFVFDLHTINLIVGLYLFFKGKLIVKLAIPSNRTYCPECGNDVTNSNMKYCPDCGTRFKGPEPMETRVTSDAAK